MKYTFVILHVYVSTVYMWTLKGASHMFDGQEDVYPWRTIENDGLNLQLHYVQQQFCESNK